jgi:hypothetical protein
MHLNYSASFFIVVILFFWLNFIFQLQRYHTNASVRSHAKIVQNYKKKKEVKKKINKKKIVQKKNKKTTTREINDMYIHL